VVELWPISPGRVEIRSEGRDYISAYRYHYAPGKWEDIPPTNMLHFRYGLDDRDHRRGLAPLRRLLRAITTDERAQAWTDSLLANYAIPGLLVTTKARLTQPEADALKAKVSATYGGDRRGQVGVLDSEADMKQFGFSPEQMELGELHDIPETRIAAVLRVPPIVAGLRAGLQRATYANFREAREAFTESTLMPLWAMDAAKVQASLVPDFAASDRRLVVAHDLTDVRALQEDEDAKYSRLHRATGGPWMTVNEARSDIGLPPLAEGDVLLLPNTVTPTAPDALLPEPAPVAPAAPADDGIPAAFRALGEPVAQRKQDAADIDDAAIAQARAWARGLAPDGYADLLDAVPVARNGHGSR
jgi:HK97 family phage portal protein